MKKGTSDEERQHIAAPPEAVYDVISDVTRMGEWSPECVSCEWIDGATGPAVGARFRGQNRHGLARWANKPRVVVADRATEFAFVATDPLGRDMTRWTYRLEWTEGGTDLVESFELLKDLPLYLRLADRFLMKVKDRRADLQANMHQTLASIRAAMEQGDPQPN
jgi:polyketide cyclase/dehydrase/lipid transport protein